MLVSRKLDRRFPIACQSRVELSPRVHDRRMPFAAVDAEAGCVARMTTSRVRCPLRPAASARRRVLVFKFE
jgi:hypothetical protein